MLFRIILFFIVFGVSLPSLANASPEASVPVEIAFIYQKKFNKIPDFEALAKQSPAYIKAPDFAKNVFLSQEIENLKALYDKADKRPTIVVFDDLEVESFDQKGRGERTSDSDLGVFSFKGFDFNKHYTYDHEGETYAVFIKNLHEYASLPIQSTASQALYSAFRDKTPIAAELTLRPALIDDKPFLLYDDKEANLILTNIVDIKLVLYSSGEVVYHQIASEWKQKSRIDRFIKDVVRGDAL